MIRRTLLLAALLAIAGSAFAQGFPSRPVRIIVPFAPGGAGDIMARLLAEQMSPTLGQQVLVENRPGAGAVIGYEAAARSAPDGHTMVTIWPSFVINHSLRKVNYDPLKDYEYVGQAIYLPLVIAVSPTLGIGSMRELVEYARTKPLSYGTPGVGTIQHALAEMIRSSTKIQLSHVPYPGGGTQVTAVAGGHLPMAVTNVVESAPHVRSGKVRPIVVTSEVRPEAMPDVPTMRESGFPEFVATNWSGLAAPRGTPQPVVARLNAELNRALAKPEIQEKLKAQGMFTAPGTPAEFATFVQAEYARYTKVVRESGMRAD
ncbi:MAG: Bug family tripartite tricarboxylate transporter substrate binding protein [Betaproteobacteria bacterium]